MAALWPSAVQVRPWASGPQRISTIQPQVIDVRGLTGGNLHTSPLSIVDRVEDLEDIIEKQADVISEARGGTRYGFEPSWERRTHEPLDESEVSSSNGDAPVITADRLARAVELRDQIGVANRELGVITRELAHLS